MGMQRKMNEYCDAELGNMEMAIYLSERVLRKEWRLPLISLGNREVFPDEMAFKLVLEGGGSSAQSRESLKQGK